MEETQVDSAGASYDELLLGLRECQRELGKLKDYNFVLKVFLSLLVLLMVFGLGVDVLLRLIKLF
jgi:hypothetical protein